MLVPLTTVLIIEKLLQKKNNPSITTFPNKNFGELQKWFCLATFHPPTFSLAHSF